MGIWRDNSIITTQVSAYGYTITHKHGTVYIKRASEFMIDQRGYVPNYVRSAMPMFPKNFSFAVCEAHLAR